MPEDAPRQRRYCPDPGKRCKERKNERDAYRRERERATGRVSGQKNRSESVDGRASARRGEAYLRFVREGWAERVAAGLLPSEAAVQFGASQTNVSRWMAAWREDELARRRAEGWCRSPEVSGLLDDFAAFRRHYFEDEWGKPYVTEPFHIRWIVAILAAMATGGRLQILSPPRHGKTQLLIHFCVWLIIRNPNIRIMWIGLNEDNAKEAVGAVLDILENHSRLVEDVLGPGGSFKPATKSGRQWSSSVFTTSTREGTGIKSPTMRAIGKGGKLLSKDVDLGVLDDVQDQDSVWSPSSRQKDEHWINTQVSSRKEDHTGLVKIGSRQHHEDLDGKLIPNLAWESIVEHAHDPACTLPVHPPREDHEKDCPDCALHSECLLWPEKRTMRFLQDQRVAMQDDVMFDMVYNNVTRPSGERYVTADQIEACKDRSRVVGRWLDVVGPKGERTKIVSIPPGTRLIAGLDPAVRGFQAAVLWAVNVDTQVRYLIDLDNRRAGGLPGARQIIQEWFDLYGCCDWVVERNNYQEAILQDREIIDFCSRNGIHTEASFTDGHNKFDPNFGVTKQLALMGQDPPLINIPWGDEETRSKMLLIIHQWLNFEPAVGRNVRSTTKSDLQMAGWMPEAKIRRWRRDRQTEIQSDYEPLAYDSGLGSSYAGIMDAV